MSTTLNRIVPTLACLAFGGIILLGGCSQDSGENTPTVRDASTPAQPLAADPVATPAERPVAPSVTADRPDPSLAAANDESFPRSISAGDVPAKDRTPARDVDPSTFQVEVTPRKLDLGDIPIGDTGRGVLKLFNKGDTPITLARCKTSCGCTTANCPKNYALAPNEELEIEVALKGGQQPDRRITKTVTLIFEDNQQLKVNVSGQAVTFIDMQPSIIVPEQAPDGRVRIASTDDTPFKITRVEPNILVEGKIPDDSLVEHIVYVDWNRWEDFGGSTKAWVYFDHPRTERLRLTIRPQTKRNNANRNANAAAQAPVGGSFAVDRLIRAGDVDGLMQQIDDGTLEIEQKDTSGSTILARAADQGKVEVVAGLIKRGADVNATNSAGRTPLMSAAQNKGNAEMVKLLLENGASIEPRDLVGFSALSWAAGFGDAESVKVLIDAGADVEIAGAPTGFTPLMWAAGFGDAESVQVLLEKGADREARDMTDGFTALMHAARTGSSVEKVQTMVAGGADLEARDNGGKTPLLVAADSSGASIDIIKALVDAGADLSATDTRGRNALDLALNRTDQRAEPVVNYLNELIGETQAVPE